MGGRIRTKPSTKEYAEGYDKIDWSRKEVDEPQRSEAEHKSNQEEIVKSEAEKSE